MTEMTPTVINERWTLLLPDYRAARVEWPYWEKERLASMHDHLGGGGHVVYDIGAEEGDFPALWGSWGNQVFLFEPNPRVWPNIRAIWEANDLGQPLGWMVGFAGAEDREAGPSDHLAAGFAEPRGGWPACAYGPLIGDHGFFHLWERVDVGTAMIDTIAAQTRPPTAITMDTEGSELLVLQGAEETLIEHRPLVWVSVHPEFSVSMYGTTREDLLAYMADLGYVSELLAVDHEEHYFMRPKDPR